MSSNFPRWLNPLEWFYAVLRTVLDVLERVITLDIVDVFVFVIGAYVILQPTLLVVWRGRWRVAAAVPLPFVGLLFWILATQGTGNLGPIPLLILLPPAGGYLVVLVMLRLGWKAALFALGHAETKPHSRPSGRRPTDTNQGLPLMPR